MGESEWQRRARDNAMANARDEELLDAAFIIVHHNIVRSTYPRIDESILAQWFNGYDAELAIAKARAMLGATYELGNAFLTKRRSYEDCIQRLTSDFPGFARKSYEAALSYGCFQAR